MYRLISCLSEGHVTWLLGVAVLISISSSLATFGLLARSRRTPDRIAIWTLAAAFTAGAGIWSTHFIGMLAYEPPGFALISYDVLLTVLSLAVAVVLAYPALVVIRDKDRLYGVPAGGALIVAAIAVMHNVGMGGVLVPGHFTYDPAYLGAAVATGSTFAVLSAYACKTYGDHKRGLVAAGLMMALAINALHFMSMTAATMIPDPSVVVTGGVLENDVLAVGVAGVMFVVVSIAVCALVADERLKAAKDEAARLNALADAVVEGIAVLDGWTIADVNASLASLAGRTREDLIGGGFGALVIQDGIFGLPSGGVGDTSGPFRTELIDAAGNRLPVECFLKRVSFRDGEKTVVAVRDLRERTRAEERIQFLAHNDSLTGLRNLASLREDLPRMVARLGGSGHSSLGLLYLDLDRFKEVNDVFGHQAGDGLLSALAERLKRLAPTMAYRHGGDEFVIVKPNAREPDEIAAFAAMIIREVSKPYFVGGRFMSVGASIGISILARDADDAEELLRHADIALYCAKSEGRSTFRLFDQAMEDVLKERQGLERELQLAVVRGELHLVYQPIGDPKTGRISAFEALLRWRSSEFGNVGPDRFIPVAEACGAIIPIGAWVLAAACREAASWDEPLIVCVNLSSVQFQQGDLVEIVESVLRESRLPPERLELEVTESVLLDDKESAGRTLVRLHELGVKIAMDDFGTGYSSLSYLQTFPFDTLKIDKSFLAKVGKEAHSSAIVETIIKLGEALDLKVVAEGVETAEQAAFLRDRNCDLIQGYLIGAPQPIAAYSHLVKCAKPADVRVLEQTMLG